MMKREDVPKMFRKQYDRAMSGRSRKAAIAAHCNMCMGWERGAAAECTARACPLFPYRPSNFAPPSA